MPNTATNDSQQAAPTERRFRRIIIRRNHNEQRGTPSEPTATADDQATTLDPIVLADPENGRNRIELGLDDGEVLLLIDDLLGLPSDTRISVFHFLARCGTSYRIRATDSDDDYDRVFDFVLNAMVSDIDVERCQAGREAAIEAACVFHPYALSPACNRIASRLRELGLRNIRPSHLLEEARQLARTIAIISLRSTRLVSEVLPDFPGGDELVVPLGWSLSGDGVSCGLSIPLAISGLVRMPNGSDYLQITFMRDGEWVQEEVSREQIASPKGVLTLTRLGLPVNSENAKDLVRYLADFEDANRQTLPTTRCVDRLGWHPTDNPHCFVLGNRTITTESVEAGPTVQVANSSTMVAFRPESEGDEQLAAATVELGTFAGWREAMAPIGPSDRAKFSFYSSLVPPIITILGAPPFVVDFSGPTSCGKTTALRIAAAPWGCPIETRESLVQNWDSTATYRQGIAHTLGNIPLILDETRLADVKDVIDTVYGLTGGQGRGRSSHAGARRRGHHSTVVISSGEVPIAEMTNKGGARARVLSLLGSPFGNTDRATAELVAEVNRGLSANYGHAGPAFVGQILRRREMWENWREQYRGRVRDLERRAGDNSVACRMAAPLASISIAAAIAHDAIDLPWRHSDVVDALWNELTAHTMDADRATAALEHAIDWARGRRHLFFDIDSARRDRPCVWAGRWDSDGEWIGFRPETLTRIFRDGGYELEPTMRVWRQREWVLFDRSSGKARWRTRIDGEQAWVIAIPNRAIEEVDRLCCA